MKNLVAKQVKTYSRDGRRSIAELYGSFLGLNNKGWIKEKVYTQKLISRKKEYFLPILSFRTRKSGKALWIISGIHGEEPAGPNAISESLNSIEKLGNKIAVVLLPLCNPMGYAKNWRYPDKKNRSRKEIARSVGSSENHLLDLKSMTPRAKKPLSKESAALTSHVINLSKKYPPMLVLDFHEDYSSKKLYIFSQGKLKTKDPIAKKVISILKKRGFKFYESGKTYFGEKIIKGIVSDVYDSSIDELLSSEKIFVNGRIVEGPRAKSVIVVETTSKNVYLKKRIKAHKEIIKNMLKFFNIAKEI